MNADNFMHFLMRKRSRAKIRFKKADKNALDPARVSMGDFLEVLKSQEHLETVEMVLAGYREFKKKEKKK